MALGFLVIMYLVLQRIVNSPTGRVMVRPFARMKSRVQMIGYNPAVYRSLAF